MDSFPRQGGGETTIRPQGFLAASLPRAPSLHHYFASPIHAPAVGRGAIGFSAAVVTFDSEVMTSTPGVVTFEGGVMTLGAAVVTSSLGS